MKLTRQTSHLLLGVAIALALCWNNGWSQDASTAIEAELSNIRALPFGYTAICSKGTLKISAPQSATFVIRNSHACQLSLQPLKRDASNHFTLCTNDPKHHAPAPKCSTILKTGQSL